MRKTSIKLQLLFLFLAFSITVISQDYTGKIVDEKGEALVGAYVSISGLKMKGTSTGTDGKFQIAAISDTDSLDITYVGYKNLRVKAESEFMTINMSPTSDLDAANVESELVGTQISLIDSRDSEVLTTTELCKAACCNLSEAFETNASIDASFTDAVTGTRQIQMLGLAGKYVQITQDNIPGVRGLSTIYGLGRIPGTWINQIYISKGAGSVTNGYESLTGQINVATFDSKTAKNLHFNAFMNGGGRVEMNAFTPIKVNDKWSTILMAHFENNSTENDRNKDGFYDMPLKTDLAFRNAWIWNSGKGWNGSYSINGFLGESESGQIPSSDQSNDLWSAVSNSSQIDVSAKTGYVWPDAQWHSFGTQFSGGYDVEEATFGSTNYKGRHQYFRANLLYWCQQTENWEYTVGISGQYDKYYEDLDSIEFDRLETVPGVYFENTWNPSDKLVVVSGIRGDYHNLYGALFSPRLHARYSITEKRAVKIAAGVGHRSPVTVMENVGLLASNRNWNFPVNYRQNTYGLDIETAVNLGLSYTHKFKLSYRPAMFAVDFYHTNFMNQVIVDRETPRELSFYNLDGKSFSNSLQVEFNFEPAKRLETKFAYRYLDVKTKFENNSDLISPPLIPTHRLFNNTAYKTKAGDNGQRWLFDITTLWTGSQRLPLSGMADLDQDRETEDYFIINTQITRDFSKYFSFYVGIENALDYKQLNPIISSENAESDLFDASVIWAPIFGRNIYAGLRWDITKK